MAVTGRVVCLQRYPVKSLLGESLNRAEVTSTGVSGDREAALIDEESGKIASAKQPRLWRDLLTLSYADTAEAGRVTGRRVSLIDQPRPGLTLDRARPDEVLAHGIDAAVGYDISTPAAGSFFDFAPIHLLTTATLRLIGRHDFARYRPNLVIDTDELEYDWVGKALHIGRSVALRVIVATPRCAVPTLAHGDLPADPDALRVPAKLNRRNVFDLGALPCAGVYAEVLSPGQVRLDDPVVVS